MYFNKTFFATHNSYTGEDRGSLRQQLDSGVRGVELDIHADVPGLDPDARKNATNTNFVIGHDYSGSQVSHANGNPPSDDLQSWLTIITDWSDANPGHAPISILFDLKDVIEEELPSLDRVCQNTFGDKFLKRAATPSDATALQGKIVAMINKKYSLKNAENLFHIPSFHAGDKPADDTANLLMNFDGSDKDRSDIEAYQQADVATRVFKPVLDSHGALAIPAGVTFVSTDHPYEHPYQQYYGYENHKSSQYVALEPKIKFRSVVWDKSSTNYDEGREPSIAINDDGVLVEVHRHQANDNLYWRVGTLAGNPPKLTFKGDKAVQYDEGIRPMVAISGQHVCEVHKAANNAGSDEIWYRIGTLRNDQIDWETDAHKLGVSGIYPAVSMCVADGKTLLIITLENSEGFNCWRIGELNPSKKVVNWENLVTTRNKNVSTPEIDINSGLVAMVWSDAGAGKIYSRIGALNDKKELEWKVKINDKSVSTHPLFYDTGVRPSIAVLENGDVIEIHKASEAGDDLWSRNGIRSGTVNVWNISETVTAGREARIAANDGFVAEVHNSDQASQLWYTLGIYNKRV